MKTLLTCILFAISLYGEELGPVKRIPLADQAAPVADPAPTEQQQPMPEIAPPVPTTYGSFILNEFKIGYFRFGDERLRHSFDKGLLDLQLCSSFQLWDPLYIYGSVEYIDAEGRTRGEHKKTEIRVVPLSLGLQYMVEISPELKYYVTAGPRYFFAGLKHKEHDWIHHHGLGGFANTGFLYYLSEHIVVDFFGEYSYKRLHFHNPKLGGDLQVGGLTFGGGVGYFW